MLDKTMPILTGAIMTVSAAAAELDVNGCRVLSKLPAPGVHPRVFFTGDELPLIRERLNAPRFKAKFDPVRRQVINSVRNNWRKLADADFDLRGVSDDDILEYFTAGEGRNQQWGIASVTAVMEQDDELLDLMRRIITNYARVMLASKERAVGGDLVGRTGAELNKRLNIWQHDGYDVGVSWTLGAAGYAVSYDVLHNHMSEEQRNTVRKAIATATKGRKSYGNGMPRGFASSNHYGYHGDLVALLAAIEGEEGFDQETWDGIVQVMRDYWEIGYTPFGYSREDGYGPNLGMRAGSRAFIVLARRGYSIFPTEKYRLFLDTIAQDYDPYPGGHLNGGASGGPYGELYPTSTIVARYMYPQSPVANFNYRHLLGEDYERRLRWQGFLDYFLYGSDWQGRADRAKMLEETGLPLSVYYPVRGKFIARSDWSSDAMYVAFDARPDAHLIGHDKVDRGNFSMSALGRVWAFSGDFHAWDESRENSLVHIDGKAQPWKAPSVRFLWNVQQDRIAGACADLKYAYDWQWTPPWPKWGQAFPAPWEPETNGPVDLGWPAEFADPDVCPKSLHGSETGYAGTNNLHRRPYNVVRKAQRSVFLIRGKHPFVIVCDDIRKDDASHLYEWVMQLPVDLKERSNSGKEVVITEDSGDRELLVRFLGDTPATLRVEEYEAATDRNGNVTKGKRLIASATCVEPKFRVLLLPRRSGQATPAVEWHGARSVLNVTIAEQADVLTFTTGEREGTRVGLER